MPIWTATIYEPDGCSWSHRFDCLTEARKFARKQTHSRGRCCIHTGTPEHGRLYAKVGGNLVNAALQRLAELGART